MKKYIYKKNSAKRFKSSNFDALGSYTGNPVMGEMPEQDADDL